MNLRTLIVDDEASGRAAVREHCRAHPRLQLVGECDSAEQALSCIRETRPDVAFLDVNMQPMNGIVLATRLQREELPLIVFVTAYDRFALQAFELNAVDYLLKPFDGARFAAAVERLQVRVGAQLKPEQREQMSRAVASVHRFVETHRATAPTERLIVEQDGRLHFIEPLDVEFLNADGNYLTIHSSRRSFQVRAVLGDMEARLPNPPFLRISRKVIVNTSRVISMERAFHGEYLLTLHGGHQFSSSRAYRERLMSVMLRARGDETF